MLDFRRNRGEVAATSAVKRVSILTDFVDQRALAEKNVKEDERNMCSEKSENLDLNPGLEANETEVVPGHANAT